MIGQELGILNPEAKARVECLVLAHTFETFWAYYLQSSGQLFGVRCRASALTFLESFNELSKSNPRIKDPVALALGEDTDVEEILTKLHEWASGETPYPYETPHMSRFMLWTLITSLKSLLIIELGLRRFPIMMFTSAEQEYSKNYVKWSGHLASSLILNQNPDELIKEASLTPTIVVVGDIRRSQDLMTYSRSVESFSVRMVEFITRVRLLLNKHHGFFDKFTGDGFLAYFNETICDKAGVKYVESFLEFLQDLSVFSDSHFADWTKEVKKMPDTPVGLAIGADLGIVSFQNLDNHLVAVDDAVVWASRMASCANANEIVVNNLLFQELRETKGIHFEERPGKTKSGEGFLARTLQITNTSK